MKEKVWGALDSPGPSAPKSTSGVEGTIALRPDPEIGTAKAVRLSALTWVLTVKVAFKGYGQADGAIPPNDGDGSQGQLCCGENEIVIEQLCSGAREKVAPGELAQLSCSVKFGTWLK